jgi:MinD-like ATPase involved in chromosome partitioning or flagellar assembly
LNVPKFARGEQRAISPSLSVFRTWLDAGDIDNTERLIENTITMFGPPWKDDAGYQQLGGIGFEGFDVIIMDIGAGAREAQTIYSYLFPRTCLVVTPEPTSTLDCYGYIKVLLTRKNLEPVDIMLIVNRAESNTAGLAITKNIIDRINEFVVPENPRSQISMLGFIPYYKNMDARNGLPRVGSIANQNHPEITTIASRLIAKAGQLL